MTSLKSKLQLALLNRKKGRNLIEKGFTLVELMIVIVIVGILSSVALPNFLAQTTKAKATECTSKMGAILSQVASEALLSEDDANTLKTALVTEANTSAPNCVFEVEDVASDVFEGTILGAEDLDGEYAANACVNYKTSVRDIKTATGESAEDDVADADCGQEAST